MCGILIKASCILGSIQTMLWLQANPTSDLGQMIQEWEFLLTKYLLSQLLISHNQVLIDQSENSSYYLEMWCIMLSSFMWIFAMRGWEGIIT